MKLWAIILGAIFFIFLGVVGAKQDFNPNPRAVSQATGRVAGELSNKPIDVQVTKNIRSELLKDDQLSNKAKNINIIVFDNGVTLKGSVYSEKERARILEHAYLTAPKHKIYNQISIKK